MIHPFPACLSLDSPIEDTESGTYIQVVYLKGDTESKTEGGGKGEKGKGESQRGVFMSKPQLWRPGT